MISTVAGRTKTYNPDLAELEEGDLAASICKDEFYFFIQEFWDVIAPGETPIWNWHIKTMADELQEVGERILRDEAKKYDLIFNVPPGSTKSIVNSIMFPAWLWSRQARIRTIGGSYTDKLAMELARKNRMIVKSDKYKYYFPHVRIAVDQDVKSYFATDQGGDRFAVGVGGLVTGTHGHVIVIDDPIDPEGARSEPELIRANRWCGETIGSRKVNKSTAVMILVMQRLHQNDPTAHLLAKSATDPDAKPIRHICLPATAVDTAGKPTNISPPELRAKYKNGYFDPIRLGQRELTEQLIDLGDYGFAGQYNQNPIPMGGGMFKTGKIHFGMPPDKFRIIIRFWDKAGTAGGGNYTVGFKMAQDFDGRFWGLDCTRGQWATDEREARIKLTAQLDGRHVVIGVEEEGGSGGKDSLLMTIRSLAGYRVRTNKPTGARGSKILRAEPWSVQVNNGNFWLPGNSPEDCPPWVGPFLREMEHWPFSTYLDQGDAGAGAFNMCAIPVRRAGAVG